MSSVCNTILVFSTFGREFVDFCGGALVKNVQSGGKSYAVVLLSKPEYRAHIKSAADILGVEVILLDFKYGHIYPDVESKEKLVRILREIRPNIVITQDPEHSFTDLDPDRRLAMILYLESLALASRDFALEKMPELKPLPIPTIYYMYPEHANCIVDITEVWKIKEMASEELKGQLTFTSQVMKNKFVWEDLISVMPQLSELKDDLMVGKVLQREMNKSTHLYYGLQGHSSKFVMAEPFRKEGHFNLDKLESW